MNRLPPDPDDLNDDRAAWAGEAVRVFQNETNTDFEDVLADLLCDLKHWSDHNGFDFEADLARACMHYEAETRDPPTQEDIFSADLAAAITEARR